VAAAHTIRERPKLLNRVRRIRGQINGIEKLLECDSDCGIVLQTLAACRGALNGLMSEVLEDHIRYHVIDSDAHPESEQAQAGEQLIDLVRSYLK
jgi:DNA-binding FrmR family transcriptional regulator